MDFWLHAILAGAVLVAAVTDLLSQRIPNWLTLPLTVLALCLHSVGDGSAGVLWGATGWLAGFALLIAFYAQGGMGAGDVKLMAMIGAFTGPYRVLWVFLYTALFGGIYALGIVVYSISSKEGWAVTGRRLKTEGSFLVLSGGDVQPLSRSLRSYPKLRYAIAMALGVAAEWAIGAPEW